MLEQASSIVRDFELLNFFDCSLTMLDAPLLTAFVERWHKKTSSFHLLFGEMIITLDDVSSLFHLPIAEDSGRLLLLSRRLHVGLLYEIWKFLRRPCWRNLALTGELTFVFLDFRISMRSLLRHRVMRLPLGCTCYI